MRQRIRIAGKSVNAVKRGSSFVIWKSDQVITPEECLKQRINWDGAWVVYEALDPFAYPFEETPHPNEGKVIEVKCVRQGDKMPDVRCPNEKRPTPKEPMKRGKR